MSVAENEVKSNSADDVEGEDYGNDDQKSMATVPQRAFYAAFLLTNLSRNTCNSDLQKLCGQMGEIRNIFHSMDENTGESRGFAFVIYKRREDAETAFETLNGFSYKNHILTANWSPFK